MYRSLLLRFIVPEVDELSIDIEDPGVLKDFKSIFIGAMTKQYARQSYFIGTSEYKQLLKGLRAFFIQCENYLQTSMPVLKSDVIKSLTFLCLPEIHQATSDKLQVLMQIFPRVITDINALESELLEYQATPDDGLPAYFDKDDKPLRIDHI